jgi:hypothetical protein
LSGSEKVLLVCAAIALGLVIAISALKLLDAALSFASYTKEQLRISRAMAALKAAGIKKIKTGHASGIWAGTYDDQNVGWRINHLIIKQAIKNDEIRGVGLGGGDATVDTEMPLAELESYFKRYGIMC